MKPAYSFSNILRPVKQHVGYLVNRATERWLGLHISLKRKFPYAAISKHRFLTVRMDVINKCNLHCKMCYFSLDHIRNLPRKEMSLSLFRTIADEVFPLAKQLVLSAGAEPLLLKSFPDMLDIAARYHIPNILFVTNGTLFDSKKIKRIIQAGVHTVIISFDGATSQTYEAIRRGATFSQVVENIRLLQEMKHQLTSSTPAIHFSTVLMRKNIEELPAILALAKELGVEHVRAAHLVPYKGLDMQNETLNLFKELTNTHLDQARHLAQQLKLSFAFPPNFSDSTNQTRTSPEIQSDTPVRRCHWPWNEILINPEGTVYPCCYWYETTSMGSFLNQRFHEIWEGENYRTLRTELTTNRLRSICLQCPIGSGIPDCNDEQAFAEVNIRRGV